MKKNFMYLVLGVTSLSLMSSCASIFTKSNQDITFKGLPGTTVIDKKKNEPITEVGQNGFSTVKMKKGLKSKTLLITKDGYKEKDVHMGTSIQPAFWGNLIFGGIPGGLIDVATGKMMKWSNNLIDVTLTEKIVKDAARQQIDDNSMQRVDRNNAGKTDMEKTVLRWYFDSDPRGARISWRVISSVPDEVKNTNETYLTTTPLEETRSFNIPGLTYENAADVTVEIKVSKRGYEDQVKRFNVRQALDQQEISGFYELVPKK